MGRLLLFSSLLITTAANHHQHHYDNNTAITTNLHSYCFCRTPRRIWFGAIGLLVRFSPRSRHVVCRVDRVPDEKWVSFF